MVDDNKMAEIRDTLTKERESIQRQLSEYEEAATGMQAVGASAGEGFADSAHVTAERSELLAFVEQLQGTREEIDGALARIDEGTYGRCERCGEAIPPERLEALPTTRLCMGCKQAAQER